MLTLYCSNRFESLQDAFVDNLSNDVRSPFDKPAVVVPNSAVLRSLTLSLADKTGVAGGIDGKYLASWLWKQADNAELDDSPFEHGPLVWRILGIFGDESFVSEHEPLRAYLASSDSVMKLALAREMASLFEKYSSYRPEWLVEWSQGRQVDIKTTSVGNARRVTRHQVWQAALWKRIAKELGLVGKHPLLRWLDELRKTPDNALTGQGPVDIFCDASVSPLHIRLINEIGRTGRQVRLYAYDYCPEFWYDIVPEKEYLGYEVSGKRGLEHAEKGNALLASWGQERAATLEKIRKIADAGEEVQLFTEQDGTSVLSAIQKAVFNMSNPVSGRVKKQDDTSVQVHVVHSRYRQIEVLHDELLRRFDADPTLKPADVIVVTPDLHTIAGMIDAVFSTMKEKIPYYVTGRRRILMNPVSQALLSVLKLAVSRVTVSSVLDVLSVDTVARRFSLTGELDLIRSWMSESGIRWGLDGDHREKFGVPNEESWTFEDGLSRLFMSFALDGDMAGVPFASKMPCTVMTDSESEVFAGFVSFISELRSLSKNMGYAKTAGDWSREIDRVIETFILPTRAQGDLKNELKEDLNRFFEDAQAAGDMEIDAAQLIDSLESEFDTQSPGGYRSGAVTFADMSAMRGQSARVICVLDMEDKTFPREKREREFDLMAMNPTAGDRIEREVSRGLFFDYLMSATDAFMMFYCGRSMTKDSESPPSILVSELLDMATTVATASDDPEARAQARKRFVVEHRVHAFSEGSFVLSGTPETDAQWRTVSYRSELCDALNEKARQAGQRSGNRMDTDQTPGIRLPGSVFVDGKEDVGFEMPDEIELTELKRFFRNPAQHFLTNRLGIRFPYAEDELSDDEPFKADYDGQDRARQVALGYLARGRNIEEAVDAVRASGVWPTGPAGELGIREFVALLEEQNAKIREFAPNGFKEPTEIETVVRTSGGREVTVKGRPESVFDGGQLVVSNYKGAATGYLNLWIDHLFLCAANPGEGVCETYGIFADGDYSITREDKAAELLGKLVELYEIGSSTLIPFLPEPSYDYGKKQDDDATIKGLEKMTTAGERKRIYARTAFRGNGIAVDDRFAELAREVFEPLNGSSMFAKSKKRPQKTRQRENDDDV